MTTNPGQNNDHVDWSRRSDSLRSSIVPSVLDPSLLHDLAEGLEFLHRQLDDSESELERSKEQSLSFEHDARRWEQEAARLREEADQTRRALDELRQEFEQSREGSRQQHETVERIVEELAEMRVARAHLEGLAAEQQRALVLSLELLKRVNAEESVAPALPGPDVATPGLRAKDHEIAELKRLLEVAGEERARADNELAAARLQLESRSAACESAQSEILALRAELENAWAELESTRAELASARADLSVGKDELQSARSELTQAEKDLKRLTDQRPPPADNASQIKGLAEERVRIAQPLRDAESEIALQTAEVESRGAIIIALENALEEQNTSLRTLEARFLAYAEQVQSMQLQRLEMPTRSAKGIALKLAKIFSPPKRRKD